MNLMRMTYNGPEELQLCPCVGKREAFDFSREAEDFRAVLFARLRQSGGMGDNSYEPIIYQDINGESDSPFIQKGKSEEGLYFTIHDKHSHVLATSRPFRNEAWYKIGCKLLADLPDAGQGVAETLKETLGGRMLGFTGILIRQNEHGSFFFEYITGAGRTLLTSIPFPSYHLVVRGVAQFREIVRGIVRESMATPAPVKSGKNKSSSGKKRTMEGRNRDDA